MKHASSLLKQYELRLLRCTLAVSSGHRQHVSPELKALEEAIEVAVEHAERGEYFEGVFAEPARLLFQSLLCDEARRGRTSEAEEFYQHVASCIASFLSIANDGRFVVEEHEEEADLVCMRALLVLVFGVLALLAFVQENITGPIVAGEYPDCPVISVEDIRKTSDKSWNLWAEKQLMIDGCDISGKCAIPQYLILAKTLLVDTIIKIRGSDGGDFSIKSWDWWACRTLLTHQHVLTERSPSLYGQLKHVTLKAVKQFGDTKSLLELPAESTIHSEEASMIATAMQLEASLVEYAYGHADSARKHLKYAEETCGLQFSIIGALGYRTVHQVEPKPQMVLVAKQVATSHKIPSEGNYDPNNQIAKKDILQGRKENTVDSADSDVLRLPRLVGDAESGISYGTDRNKQRVLSSVEQALVLAYCLDVKQSGPDGELRGWQMAPFIEAVDAQEHSEFMVSCCCQLLRIRWERRRNRTRERAYCMMEQLVGKIQGASVKVTNRMSFAFCVAFPTIASLLKEYAELMMSCGLVGEALGLFEKLELWDNLIDCYCLLGKKAAAVNLIEERLNHHPSDPRLWCSLGDVTVDDKCYINAWEVSNHRFARAQRSLGRSAYNRGDYERSSYHWNIALSINPLHPGGWFAFGSAALKERDLDKAIDAFTRAVQLDPENGEAWNNIAAIHMTRKRSKEAFVAFREALKFRRDSWQMWENFAQVALDIQKFSQVVMSLQMVLELSAGQHIDLDFVAKLLDQIKMRKVSSGSKTQEVEMKHQVNIKDDKECRSAVELGTQAGDNTVLSLEDNVNHQNNEVEQLVELTGDLLKQIISSGQSGGEIWGLLARWHKMKGNMTMAAEALLKQVRAYQGLDWQRSHDSFQKFAHVSLDLCEAYLKIASVSGSKRELHTARMHLRNTMKQGGYFVDDDKYKELESLLLKVEDAIQCL